MFLNRVSFFLSIIMGLIFIVLGAIPAVFNYPYSDGPYSGPSNLWEFILMIAYELWLFFLIVGFALCLLSIYLHMSFSKLNGNNR